MKILVFLLISLYSKCYICEKLIDLSWPFNNETVYWTGTKRFQFTKFLGNSERGYWYAMREFCAAEHGGTHFDAPYHFYEDGWTTAQVPVDRLISKGALVDISEVVQKNGPDTELFPEHLIAWEKQNGDFENGTILLIRFGYSQYWPDKVKYMGLNGDKLNFPGISKAAAEWIAKSGKFYGVGVDTSSVDSGKCTEFWTHRILNKEQMYFMENVKITENLPVKGFKLIVLPMNIENGTGGPLRIVAVV